MVAKDFYYLTKPGIIYGNALTLIAGFFFASQSTIDFWLLLSTVLGLSLVVGSGCIFNNYIDRDIDAVMERTKHRALVKARIPLRIVLLYGALMGLAGFSILFLFTNSLAVIAAMVGFFVYVVVYSLWLKRSSTYSTLIGGISGAMPPVVGYLAVTSHLDVGAFIVFCILMTWQMPHFFGIAIYRMSDYASAHIPVLPVKEGIKRTKIEMLLYTGLFSIAVLLPSVFGYTGKIYIYVMAFLGLAWVALAIKGFFITSSEERHWARQMFLFSIVVLLIFCIMIVFGRVPFDLVF